MSFFFLRGVVLIFRQDIIRGCFISGKLSYVLISSWSSIVHTDLHSTSVLRGQIMAGQLFLVWMLTSRAKPSRAKIEPS
jgi:uncharacterized protein HemY